MPQSTPSAPGQPLVSALRGEVKRKSSAESKGSGADQTGEDNTPQRSDKAPRPKGTSPMRIEETVLDDSSKVSSTKSDPKDSDSGSKGDSLEKEIGGARRDLFQASSGVEDDDDMITVATSKSKKWKP